MITIVLSVVVILVLAIFFWFWWFAPRSSVPIHSTPAELRRLEVQDRLRQTNYQVLTAVGLAATFLISLAQFIESRTHWEADFKSKAEQDRLSTFMNAVKLITDGSTIGSTENSATNAGVRTLGSLGIDDASAHAVQATQILGTFVANQTHNQIGALDLSDECKDAGWIGVRDDAPTASATRREPNSAVQAAMRALGDKRMASFRPHGTSNKCVKPTTASPQLRLEHAELDNLDLSGLDLSCSMLSQAKFRRTSLNGANLAFSDLRGARFADYDIKNSPSQRADGKPAISGAKLYAKEWEGGPPEWRLYRCWISDMRYANLAGAQLDGAALDGADLREADFTGARFSNTDLSRANLTGAYGLTEDMLKHACAGVAQPQHVDVAAQPVGLSAWTKGRLTPCYVGDEVQPASNPAAEVRPDVDLPTTEDVAKADVEMAARLGSRKPWAVFVDDYWRPIGLPWVVVLGALTIFQLVGIRARRVFAPVRGILSTLPPRFPEKTLHYSAAQLALFIHKYPQLAKAYRSPILFPLDLIVMSSLAAATAYASWIWLSSGEMIRPAYGLIFPVLYWVTDLVEDLVLRSYLAGAHFDEITIGWLKRLTLAKMIFVSLALAQVPICFVAFLQNYF